MNKLEMNLCQALDENEEMRRRLGLDPSENIDLSGLFRGSNKTCKILYNCIFVTLIDLPDTLVIQLTNDVPPQTLTNLQS